MRKSIELKRMGNEQIWQKRIGKAVTSLDMEGRRVVANSIGEA